MAKKKITMTALEGVGTSINSFVLGERAFMPGFDNFDAHHVVNPELLTVLTV